MKMIDVLLAEMDQEAQSTARVLERVPQAQLSWRPHAKSMSLGQLALHVATIPGNVAELAVARHDSRAAAVHPGRSGHGRRARARAQGQPREGAPGARRHGRCDS